MRAALEAVSLLALAASWAFAFQADGRWEQYGEPRRIGPAVALFVLAGSLSTLV